MPALRAIARRAYAPYVPRIGREPAPVSADYAALVADGAVRVLESAGAVVGYVVAYRDDDALHLENVAVDPAHAGRGYGRRLVEIAEGLARELGLPRVELYTNGRMVENIVLYAHLGYVETGRRRDDGYERVYFAKAVERSAGAASHADESPA